MSGRDGREPKLEVDVGVDGRTKMKRSILVQQGKLFVWSDEECIKYQLKIYSRARTRSQSREAV